MKEGATRKTMDYTAEDAGVIDLPDDNEQKKMYAHTQQHNNATTTQQHEHACKNAPVNTETGMMIPFSNWSTKKRTRRLERWRILCMVFELGWNLKQEGHEHLLKLLAVQRAQHEDNYRASRCVVVLWLFVVVVVDAVSCSHLSTVWCVHNFANGMQGCDCTTSTSSSSKRTRSMRLTQQILTTVLQESWWGGWREGQCGKGHLRAVSGEICCLMNMRAVVQMHLKTTTRWCDIYILQPEDPSDVQLAARTVFGRDSLHCDSKRRFTTTHVRIKGQTREDQKEGAFFHLWDETQSKAQVIRSW
jgi:hypothetical protein